MSEHTPAPWMIHEYGNDETPALVIHKGETENRICFMATPGSYGDPAIIEADAHLIAAAPDLKSELIAYHDREWRVPHEGLPAHKAGEFPEQCGGCAAIARARGEAA